MMYRIVKVLNHNTFIGIRSKDKCKCLIMGKGIAFGRKVSESISAGSVMTARLSSGQPSSGSDLSLQALAAVYIGGTFNGSMFNTLAGALVWGFINNSLNLLGVSAYWQKVVLGGIIILAVLLDTIRAKVSVKKQ